MWYISYLRLFRANAVWMPAQRAVRPDPDVAANVDVLRERDRAGITRIDAAALPGVFGQWAMGSGERTDALTDYGCGGADRRL
jgi:hypothetical protein